MAYRLALDGGLAESLRAVAREQLEGAAEGLATPDDPVKAVHDARKRVKRTRALLRLVRPGMGDKAYRAQNVALRDTARELSGARDADVMVETVEGLHERYAGQVPATTFGALRDHLAERAAAQRSGADPADAADAFRGLASGADGWVVAGDASDVLLPGLRRTYARGRDAFALADREPTAERLHEWRKRVKDLWYQQELVAEAWPGVLGAQADEAHELSQLLGDDHDLAVLAELLETEPDLTDAAGAFHELIGRRRAELLDAVRALGRRVYAESPNAYARRLDRYLEAPRAEAPVAG